MLLNFSKMQGLGNDFVVIDAINQDVNLSAEQIRSLADRHYGIGCDQLLLLERPRSENEDFFYRIFNANGSEVAQCGNGVRCLAKFIEQQKLSTKRHLKIATQTTVMETYLLDNDAVKVNMGKPIFDAPLIPVIDLTENNQWAFLTNDQSYSLTVLSMGNPHAVTWVDNIDLTPVEQIGSQISTDKNFPQHTNVGFMQKQTNQHIKLRVYERHAGETLACGSGACAAVVAGILQKKLDSTVTASLRGGDLTIEWQGPESSVWMTGAATFVFSGTILLT